MANKTAPTIKTWSSFTDASSRSGTPILLLREDDGPNHRRHQQDGRDLERHDVRLQERLAEGGGGRAQLSTAGDCPIRVECNKHEHNEDQNREDERRRLEDGL